MLLTREGVAMTATEAATPILGYTMHDADEHSTPAMGAYEKYIDPDKKHMAITYVTNEQGRREISDNGRRARFTFKNFKVVGSNEQLAELGVKDSGSSDEMGGQVIPGSPLTCLPEPELYLGQLKNLSDEDTRAV